MNQLPILRLAERLNDHRRLSSSTHILIRSFVGNAFIRNASGSTHSRHTRNQYTFEPCSHVHAPVGERQLSALSQTRLYFAPTAYAASPLPRRRYNTPFATTGEDQCCPLPYSTLKDETTLYASGFT